MRPVAAGLLGSVALPPIGCWPAGILGVAVLCGELTSRRRGGRALAGLLYGIGYFSPSLVFAAEFSGVGYGAFVLLEAGFYAVAAVLVPRSRFALPGFVGAFGLAEWARGVFPFGGAPLGAPAIGQVGGPLAEVARLAGPLAVSLLVFGLGAALCGFVAALLEVARRGRDVRRRPDASMRWPAAMGLGCVAVIGVALLAPSGGVPLASLRVAAVEGGGPRGLTAEQAAGAGVLTRTLGAAGSLVGPYGVVLWPEDVLALPGGASDVVTEDQLGDEARDLRATLIVGATILDHARFKNEMLVFSPRGVLVSSYEKIHPVPFGEYVPWRGLLRHFVSLNSVPLDAIAGHAPGVVRIADHRVGLVVSYEAFFPGLARSTVRRGAEALLVPTNTASYASAQVPAEELAASRLDAIATGRDVLQAATVGYSAIITPSGSVGSELGFGTSGALVGTLTLRSGMTPYDDAGDLPPLVLCLAMVFGAAAAARRRLRGRCSAPPRWPRRRPSPPDLVARTGSG